eukprot:GEMP01020328.1.p1 GENE.GEMP01020328.1~~GEMP01020328.1.p1  ORF type:complete len:592 (+),score=109.51 GEMP01020328.1:72-1778(+)
MSKVHGNGWESAPPVGGNVPTVFRNIRLNTHRCQPLPQRALTIQPRRITAMAHRLTVASNISTYRNSMHLASCCSITGTRSMAQLHRSPTLIGNDFPPPRRQSVVSLSSLTSPTDAPGANRGFNQVRRQTSQSYCALPHESSRDRAASSFPHPGASSSARPTATLSPPHLPQLAGRSCTPTPVHRLHLHTAQPVHSATPSHAAHLHARQLRFLPGSRIKMVPLRVEPLNNLSFSRTRAHLRAYNQVAPCLPTPVKVQTAPILQCSPVNANLADTRCVMASPRVVSNMPAYQVQSTCKPVQRTSPVAEVIKQIPTLDHANCRLPSYLIVNPPLERVSENDTAATTTNESPCISSCHHYSNETSAMLLAGGRLDAESTWMDEDHLANSSDDNGGSLASTEVLCVEEMVEDCNDAAWDIGTGRAKWKRELEALGEIAGGRQCSRRRDGETMSDVTDIFVSTPRRPRRVEEMSEMSKGSSLSPRRVDDQWQRRVAVLDMSDVSDEEMVMTPRRKKKMHDGELSETDEEESVRLETPPRFPMHLSFVTRFNREQRQRESEKSGSTQEPKIVAE